MAALDYDNGGAVAPSTTAKKKKKSVFEELYDTLQAGAKQNSLGVNALASQIADSASSITPSAVKTPTEILSGDRGVVSVASQLVNQLNGTQDTGALPTLFNKISNAASQKAMENAAENAAADEAESEMSAALRNLMDQYNNTPVYTSKTAEEIEAQARGETSSYYEQLRLAAQQAQERGDLALAQQLNALQRSYEQQREETAKAYNQAYSQADRQLLSRGMQRSSYGAQTLANLSQQGAEAQNRIGEAQTADIGNIEAQRTQLAEQLAEKLEGYSANEAADVLARIKELEDQNYERGMTNAQYRNQLASQIYEYLTAEKSSEKADEWKEREFAESVRQFDLSNELDRKELDRRLSNDEITSEQWMLQYNHALENDAITHDQWQQQMDYQRDRGRISDEQWEQQMAYQKSRDTVSDEQWNKTFEASQEQWQKSFDRDLANDKISAEQWAMQYNLALEERKISSDQWLAEFNYQKERGLISDQQWQEQMDYQRDRGLISDQQWQMQMDYQKDKDAVTYTQWQTEFTEGVRQFNETHKESSGGGGSSGSSSAGTTGTGTNGSGADTTGTNGTNGTTTPKTGNWNSFMNTLNSWGLNGNSNGTTTLSDPVIQGFLYDFMSPVRETKDMITGLFKKK